MYVKKNKNIGWIIGSIAFAVVGAILLIVGFCIEGFDIVKWWNAGWGPTVVIVCGAGAFILILLLIALKDYQDGSKYK